MERTIRVVDGAARGGGAIAAPPDSIDVLLVAGDTRGSRVLSQVLAAHWPRVRAWAVHGLAAIRAFASGRTPFERTPIPRLVLVDLERDALEGAEVLRLLRAGLRCRGLPIVGFGAPSARDACAGGASCCVAPASERGDLVDVFARTVRFWCEVVALPGQARANGATSAAAPGSAWGTRPWGATPVGAVPDDARASSGCDPRAPVHILMVEDVPGDVLLATAVVDRAGGRGRLHVVGDAESARAYLGRRPPHGAAVRPDVVLLDLSVPGGAGEAVLTAVKRDPASCTIPVVVLAPPAATEIDACYARRADCCIRKPGEGPQLALAMAEIERFWCGTAELPRG